MNPLILIVFVPIMIWIAGFPSHWDDNGITDDEIIILHELETSRRVAVIDRRNSLKSRPSHSAEKLHDGIQPDRRDNVPIKELMEGFKGVL